jgi:hypothetical protein
MAARLAEIRPFLDERAWRLLLGAEARAIGYGGMKVVAAAAKAKADTVSRGAHELESGVVPDGRVRAPGAGRPAAEVSDPGECPRFRGQGAGQGDPVRGVRRDGEHRVGQCRDRRLLITADSGGSNGGRLRLWKTELAGLAAETGLEITVTHLPPGTSKWNRIEHRLFSHISMNWRAGPRPPTR